MTRKTKKNSKASSTENPKQKFGPFIRELRISKNLMLKEVADAGGITSAYLCDIEFSRRNPPSSDVIVRIAQFLGASPARLLKLSILERGDLNLETDGLGAEEQELAILFAIGYKDLNSSEIKKVRGVLGPKAKGLEKVFLSQN